MAGTPWTTEALLARLDVVTALDAAPSPPTPHRAQIRLELIGIVTAVDNSAISATHATSLLEGLLSRALRDVGPDGPILPNPR